MADVFRGKSSAVAPGNLIGYAFHGGTAMLVLFFIMKALGV